MDAPESFRSATSPYLSRENLRMGYEIFEAIVREYGQNGVGFHYPRYNPPGKIIELLAYLGLLTIKENQADAEAGRSAITIDVTPTKRGLTLSELCGGN